MNKTIKIMAALLPLFFTSCNNDDANVTTAPQQEQIVTISAGITRAGENGTTESFSYDKIKVINVTRQGKGLPYSQAVFTWDPSGTTATWTNEGTLLWCAGMENTFQAVYPATADYSSFTVPADQSDATKLASADWMTGEAKATLDNLTQASSIDINLTRKMAMVVVEISGDGLDVSTLTSLTVYYPSYDGTDITYENNNEHTIKACKGDINDNQFSAIIAPGAKGSRTTLCTLTLSGSDEKRLILERNIEFSAGRKYTFQCNMSSPSSGAKPRSAAPDNLTLVSVDPM